MDNRNVSCSNGIGIRMDQDGRLIAYHLGSGLDIDGVVEITVRQTGDEISIITLTVQQMRPNRPQTITLEKGQRWDGA